MHNAIQLTSYPDTEGRVWVQDYNAILARVLSDSDIIERRELWFQCRRECKRHRRAEKSAESETDMAEQEES